MYRTTTQGTLNKNMPRVLTIIAVIIGIIVVVAAGYFVWQYIGVKGLAPAKTAGTTTATPTSTAAATSAAAVAAAGNGLLADTFLLSYSEANGETIGVQTDGQIIKIAGGKATPINSSVSGGIISVEFSYDGTKILAKLGPLDNPVFSVFDVKSGAWSPLANTNISSATWSPDSIALAYIEHMNGKSSLDALDLSNAKAKPKILASVFETDSDISWLNKNEITISSKPSKFAAGSVWKYKIKEQKFEPIAVDEYGVWIKWSKDGLMGLKYSFANKNKNTIVDGNGVAVTDTSFITLPDKCAFETPSNASGTPRYLYCAIPREIPDGINLPDDYLARAVYLNDGFYQINLTSGQATEITNGGRGNFDATDLSVSSNKLTFINRRDRYLYQFAF